MLSLPERHGQAEQITATHLKSWTSHLWFAAPVWPRPPAPTLNRARALRNTQARGRGGPLT